MTSEPKRLCVDRPDRETCLPDQSQAQIAAVLKDIITAAEQATLDEELSNEQLFVLVIECERNIDTLKQLIAAIRASDAREGSEDGKGATELLMNEPVLELMRRADGCLKHFIREISERRQRIAADLNSMRMIQRAAKAYRGITAFRDR